MKCILVEYYDALKDGDNHSTTFELFRSVTKAFDFAKSVHVCKLDLIETNNAYYEDGELNYEDFSNTILHSIWKDTI